MGLDDRISATKCTNLNSLIVGRSVSLVVQARRTAYTGGGQFDLTRDGALVHLLGVDAATARLVRQPRGGAPVSIAVDSLEAPRILEMRTLQPSGTVPSVWLADDFLLVNLGFAGSRVRLVDPTKDPARVDTLGLHSIVAISPDRK